MRDDDLRYFRKRALEEQIAAQRSACEAARHRHDELAAMYRFRAAMLSMPNQCWAEASEKESASAAA